jgi:hypothetical protein
VESREGSGKDARAECSQVVPPEYFGDEILSEEKNETRKDPVVWTVELEAIIREGYSRGLSGAREAINKIQSLHPKWRSHNVWERAKELGFDQKYVQERPPWSVADDAVLHDFAQEQSVKTIARWLHRTEAAVRRRFTELGESSRVQDNYTQEELARDLRVSPKTVRRWEAAGYLERRDGRITHESLEEFCRKHASEIKFEALDREMQLWLKDCAGFVFFEKQPKNGSGSLKHLQKVGICPWCGRKTRGNAHGRHLKACVRRNNLKNSLRVPARQAHVLAGQSLSEPTTKSLAACRHS